MDVGKIRDLATAVTMMRLAVRCIQDTQHLDVVTHDVRALLSVALESAVASRAVLAVCLGRELGELSSTNVEDGSRIDIPE